MFQKKVVEKITYILYSIFFFENTVEKYCIDGQAQYGACTFHGGYLRLHARTHTHTHTHYVTIIAFPL